MRRCVNAGTSHDIQVNINIQAIDGTMPDATADAENVPLFHNRGKVTLLNYISQKVQMAFP